MVINASSPDTSTMYFLNTSVKVDYNNNNTGYIEPISSSPYDHITFTENTMTHKYK